MGITFGHRLQVLRRDRRLTRTELGGEFLRAADLAQLEKGRREPSDRTIRFLAKRLTAGPGFPKPSDGEDSRFFWEFSAFQAWDERSYGTARRHCRKAAQAALAEADSPGWWDMSLLAAACLRRLNQYTACIAETELLAQHPLAAADQPLLAQAETLLAAACQSAGRLPEAVAHARRALELGFSVRLKTHQLIEVYRALVSALSESGLQDEAWGHCRVLLIPLLEASRDPQLTGRGFWAVGDVAFRRGDTAAALRYHCLAGSLLTPAADLEVWAAFNQASAAMRLSAGLHDAGTCQCMLHAETALAVLNGTEEDALENLHSRGRWLQLSGNHEAAVEVLTAVYRRREALPPQGAAEVVLHLALSRAALGDAEDAARLLEDSAAGFLAAGAPDRAGHASRLACQTRAGNSLG